MVIIMGKKKMEEIFDIPEEKIVVMVKEMKNESVQVVEKTVEPVIPKKEDKRKNNVTEEGKAKMLLNLKKGRETRKVNLNKQHELRQNELKSEIAELKTLVKETIAKKIEAPKVEEPKKVEAPKVKIEALKVVEAPKEEVKPVVKQVAIPVLQQKVSIPYFVKSTFKKPSYW